MLKTGICSITFRQHSVAELVAMVHEAGLDAIEWGGDVHVPPGDISAATETRYLTEGAGLTVSSYGSYYTILDEQGAVQDFGPVLDSTLALGADTVRIWAGCKGSDIADEQYRGQLIETGCRITEHAARSGVRVAFEFHNHTLTDTNESAGQLLQEINHPNLYTYWQPMYWGPDMDYRLQGLEILKEKILNLHVFHWEYDSSKEKWNEAVNRRPLSEGMEDWQTYLSVPLPEKDRFALIEFVRDDDPSQFFSDASALKQWVKGAQL